MSRPRAISYSPAASRNFDLVAAHAVRGRSGQKEKEERKKKKKKAEGARHSPWAWVGLPSARERARGRCSLCTYFFVFYRKKPQVEERKRKEEGGTTNFSTTREAQHLRAGEDDIVGGYAP